MLTLALDTSSVSASVALASGGAIIGSICRNKGLTHSQTLLPAVDSLLTRTNVSRRQVDKLAVCVGPGSFTGLRIGVATAKGLAMALNVKVVTLSSLQVVAASVIPAPAPESPPVFACINARRGTVYTASYDENLNEISPPRQLLLSELESKNIIFDTDLKQGLAPAAALLAEEQEGINPANVVPFYLRQALEKADV